MQPDKRPADGGTPWLSAPRGVTGGPLSCPWGRDCPWDWPRHVAFRTRLKWATEAIWYALSGQPPKEPRVIHAALTREDLTKAAVVADAKIQEILATIQYYEQELHTFHRGGGPSS